jgi:hypothetical protein
MEIQQVCEHKKKLDHQILATQPNFAYLKSAQVWMG